MPYFSINAFSFAVRLASQTIEVSEESPATICSLWKQLLTGFLFCLTKKRQVKAKTASSGKSVQHSDHYFLIPWLKTLWQNQKELAEKTKANLSSEDFLQSLASQTHEEDCTFPMNLLQTCASHGWILMHFLAGSQITLAESKFRI